MDALHAAAQAGDLAAVQSTVQAQVAAFINAPNSDGMTALHLAVQSDTNESLVGYLLDHGADTEAAAADGQCALHKAAAHGSKEMVALLLSFGADPERHDDEGWSPLDIAAQKNNGGAIDALLDHGVDVNSKPEDGWTPLHSAAYEGSLEAAKALLRRGADVGVQNTGCDMPLHFAAREDADGAVTELLIQHMQAAGVDINASNDDGSTALHYAAIFGKQNAAKALIAHGADVNAVSTFHGSVLFAAALFGRADVVDLLMEAGAVMVVPDCRGDNRDWFRRTPNFPLLVAAGCDAWDRVPSPCAGLERALLAVWCRSPEEELPKLFSRLEDRVKQQIRAALRCLRRTEPGLEEVLRVQIVAAALT